MKARVARDLGDCHIVDSSAGQHIPGSGDKVSFAGVHRRFHVTFEQSDVDGLKAYLEADEGGTLPPQLKSADPRMLRGVLERIEAELSDTGEEQFTEDEAEELEVLGDACIQYAILLDDPAEVTKFGTCFQGLARSIRPRLG